jgi:hypothetical protein
MTANNTTTNVLGRLLTMRDLSNPDISYHDPSSAQIAQSMVAYTRDDSDQWFRNAVSRTDITTEGTRSWIESVNDCLSLEFVEGLSELGVVSLAGSTCRLLWVYNSRKWLIIYVFYYFPTLLNKRRRPNSLM